MDANINEWLGLFLRWAHLIAGIAWIGSSFYFIWLDSHLTRPEKEKDGVEGELWMVHSGGFYQVERRKIGPGQVPATLHWFKWEAAFTWISGLLLLIVVYYMTGGIYLIDPSISKVTPGAAAGIGIGAWVISWFVYDSIWNSRFGENAVAASIICFLLLLTLVFGLSHILSGRAAYIHIGAILGTLMTANVWLRILPAQQQMIDATQAGKNPDFTLGARAKRRSVHNSYMTFPVIFIMLSNHYPHTYGHRFNWVILTALMLAGAGVRHFMISKSHAKKWVLVPVAGLVFALFSMTSTSQPPLPAVTSLTPESRNRVQFAEARAVISRRCVACHSANPSDRAFGVAPAGVNFDTNERIKSLAERIKFRAVVSKTMPLGNKTGMTQEERNLLGKWVEEGARIE